MHIGLLIAFLAGLIVSNALGRGWGLIAGSGVFAIWFAIREARRRSREAGGNGQYSGSSNGVGTSSGADSSSHGGGTFGGAGATGFWGVIFDSTGGGHSGDGSHDGGGHGGNGGNGSGNGGGNGGH